jgi:hypothetical protein
MSWEVKHSPLLIQLLVGFYIVKYEMSANLIYYSMIKEFTLLIQANLYMYMQFYLIFFHIICCLVLKKINNSLKLYLNVFIGARLKQYKDKSSLTTF